MNEQLARAAFEAAMASHRSEFEHFFQARLLGLKFSYDGDSCGVEFEVQDFMFNPQGSLHGGVIATVMDISMGHLLKHMEGPDTTLEMKTQYVKPARLGSLRCRGEFIKRGKGISYLRSTITDEAGDLVAFATSTWKCSKREGTGEGA